MDSKKKVPRISWDQVVPGKEMSQSTDYIRYRGSFKSVGTRKSVPVTYKKGRWEYGVVTDDLMDETQVLIAIQGVKGVPYLYGLTDTPPIALVISFCPGKQLRQLQRSANARSYLAALREVCIILGEVHKKGAAHRNVTATNILVVTGKKEEEVEVSLVSFNKGVLTKDKTVYQYDADQVVILMRVMHDKINESSDLYKHREKLLIYEHSNLTAILKGLCSILHGNPAKCAKCKFLNPGI